MDHLKAGWAAAHIPEPGDAHINPDGTGKEASTPSNLSIDQPATDVSGTSAVPTQSFQGWESLFKPLQRGPGVAFEEFPALFAAVDAVHNATEGVTRGTVSQRHFEVRDHWVSALFVPYTSFALLPGCPGM